MKSHSKPFMFFAVSKQIPVVYSADRLSLTTVHGVYVNSFDYTFV